MTEWIIQYQQKSGRVTHKNFFDEEKARRFCAFCEKRGLWYRVTMWI